MIGFGVPVVFEQGAMPRLAELRFKFLAPVTREMIKGGFDLGLGNLPSLEVVTVELRRGGAGEEEVEEAGAAVAQAVEFHPNYPRLHVI